MATLPQWVLIKQALGYYARLDSKQFLLFLPGWIPVSDLTFLPGWIPSSVLPYLTFLPGWIPSSVLPYLTLPSCHVGSQAVSYLTLPSCQVGSQAVSYLTLPSCQVGSQAVFPSLPPGWLGRKVSVSKATDPGFDSRLRLRDFSGSSHTSDLQMDTRSVILPLAWRYGVRAGTGWPGVSTLGLGEAANLIRNFWVNVAARNSV